MPKLPDIKNNIKKNEKEPWNQPEHFHMYEAVLDGVFFDWLSSADPRGAEEECREYLNEFTNGYRMTKFYVKDENANLT